MQGSNDEDMIHPDQDSDNDQADHDANPLVVPLLEDMPTQEEIATKWFSQDVFAEDDDEYSGGIDSEDDMQMDGPVDHPKKTKKDSPKDQVKGPKNNLQDIVPKVQTTAKEDFEIVPAPATDSSDSSSSDESDVDDVETRAEILACAKKMLRKKQREEILDDAYNKYMFHDDAGLPQWFLDEEKRHRQPMKPVTKEEIAAMRAQFKEIDARPAKKVAEAKARKKRAAHRKLEKVRKKANSISDQADISDRSKRKMIDQLYKKAVPKKPEKEYVVAKKGVQVRAGKGKVLVDRRMKKDARSRKTSQQGKGGKKGKQKGKGSRPTQAKAKKRGS